MNQVNLIKGPDLKLKLKKKGVLSVDICRAFGYNKTTVSRYLSGNMQMPASFIFNVAIFAGFNIADLVEVNKDKKDYLLDENYTDVIDILSEPDEIYHPITKELPAPIKEDTSAPVHTKSSLIQLDTTTLEKMLQDMQSVISDLNRSFTVMSEQLNTIKSQIST